MRRIRFGVGMTLDAFIADDHGATNFLVSDPTYDSAPFFASIDSVIMGRVTYTEAVRQGMRVYPGLKTYVVSRTLEQANFPEVTIIGGDAERAIAGLRREPGKDIWLCGGGILFRSLIAAGLVDTVELGVSPLLLARPGRPMIECDPPLSQPVRLELTRYAALPSGLLLLEYAVVRTEQPER
jgi:dihydrofolate reductase